MYDLSENDDFDREEIATYEEVARLFPRPGVFRPVVLIGPPGVGRNELKRRLIALDPDRYKATVPREYKLEKRNIMCINYKLIIKMNKSFFGCTIQLFFQIHLVLADPGKYTARIISSTIESKCN